MNLHQREAFLTYTTLFLLVLLVITMGLAAWGDLRPLAHVAWTWRDLGIGVGCAILMISVFGFITPVRNEAEEILGPSLAACRWYDFIPLAILVGIIEELLFRGVLEPWAARLDPLGAMIAVNVLFGLLHAVSWSYAIVAAVLGGVLSLLAQGPGEYNLLRPIVAHAVYDYFGFLWIARSFRMAHPNWSAADSGDGADASWDDEP